MSINSPCNYQKSKNPFCRLKKFSSSYLAPLNIINLSDSINSTTENLVCLRFYRKNNGNNNKVDRKLLCYSSNSFLFITLET